MKIARHRNEAISHDTPPPTTYTLGNTGPVVAYILFKPIWTCPQGVFGESKHPNWPYWIWVWYRGNQRSCSQRQLVFSLLQNVCVMFMWLKYFKENLLLCNAVLRTYMVRLCDWDLMPSTGGKIQYIQGLGLSDTYG